MVQEETTQQQQQQEIAMHYTVFKKNSVFCGNTWKAMFLLLLENSKQELSLVWYSGTMILSSELGHIHNTDTPLSRAVKLVPDFFLKKISHLLA